MTEPKVDEKAQTPKLLLKKPPATRITRTNQDKIMIILGIGIIVFLVVAVIFSVQSNEKNAQPIKFKGPVEDPYKYGTEIHNQDNPVAVSIVNSQYLSAWQSGYYLNRSKRGSLIPAS